MHRSIGCKSPSNEWRHIRDKILNQAKKVCQELGVGVPRLRIHECRDIRWPGRLVNGFFRPSSRHIFLNRKLLVDEFRYEITFAHEVCHAICRKTPKGKREPAHGATWQMIMKKMGQPVPEKYEDPHYDRKVKRLGRWKIRRRVRGMFRKKVKMRRTVQKKARRIMRRHRG